MFGYKRTKRKWGNVAPYCSILLPPLFKVFPFTNFNKPESKFQLQIMSKSKSYVPPKSKFKVGKSEFGLRL